MLIESMFDIDFYRLSEPSSCGAYHLDGDTSFQPTSWQSASSQSHQSTVSVTLASLSTATYQWIDAHLTQLVSSCFGLLRQIRCIRCSLPREALTLLVASFITSKIDNCNVALAGLPQRDLDRIQSVLNAAAVQHDSRLMRASSTMWHHCSWTCTGCVCLNASSINFAF